MKTFDRPDTLLDHRPGNAFDAVLHGAGAAADGLAVRARFDGERLLLEDVPAHGEALDGAAVIDAAALVVSVGGLDRPALFLNWHDHRGAQVTLQLLNDTAIAALLAGAPPSLQPQLAQWRQRGRNGRQVWGWLGATAAACVLPLALLWWQAPHAISWLAGKIPLSVEEKLGQAALAQLRLDGGLIESGPQQKMVRQLGARLTQGSAYRYRWIVKRDPSVNAFAMPGAIVVVHTGLLDKAANPTELAAVLAHEVQHIEQRHALRQLITSLGWGALLTVTVGDLSTITAVIAHQAGTLYFSRDMEDEADRLGFQALLRARIRPDGMLTFFRTLEREQRKQNGSAALPAWASSHPQTAQRIARIAALIAGQPCPACRPVGGDLKQPETVGAPP